MWVCECVWVCVCVGVCVGVCVCVFSHLVMAVSLSVLYQDLERLQKERNRRAMTKLLNAMVNVTYRTTWTEVCGGGGGGVCK